MDSPFLCLFILCQVHLHGIAQQVIVSSIQLDGERSLDGLLVTPDGTLYGTEGYDGSKLFKINMDGTTSVVADGLNGPIDLDFDTEGNLYLTTFNNRDLYKIIPGNPFEVIRFANVNVRPSGVVVNRANGNIYVSHYGSGFPGNGNSIWLTTPGGISSTFIQGRGLKVPVSLAIDENGNLYAPNIAYAKGNLYVTGNSSQPFIFKVSLEGEYEVIAGDGTIGYQDGMGLQAKFDAPNGIASSITGDTLFVSELNNPKIIRVIALNEVNTLNWEIKDLSSGNYLVRMVSGNKIAEIKTMVLRSKD